MFEILENDYVLHSQINPEKDNSEVAIFKISLNKDIRFKTANLKLKEYFKPLSGLHLNNHDFCSLNNSITPLNVLFVDLEQLNYNSLC